MLNLFNTVAQHNSPADKLRILGEYPYQSELKEILRYATDPFITFGITSLEKPAKWASRNEDQAYQVLDLLASRRVTGNEARLRLGACCMDEEDLEIFTRVVRKDLRCGVGEKLVLQLYPALIRQFDVMRAKKFEKLPSRGTFAIEPKYDGLRCIAMVENSGVTLLSRNGKEFTSSDHLKDQLLKLTNGGSAIFDGELTSGNFNSSVSAVKRKSQQNDATVFNIFDVLSPDEWKSPVTPYYQRRNHLEWYFGNYHGEGLMLTPSLRISDETEAYSRYAQFLAHGYEGGIVKNVNGIYRFKRHQDWLKLKETNDVDLRVESLVQGEGKYHGMLGAAIVKYHNKRVSIGTGFGDEERDYYWKNPNELIGKVIEIHYHQETPDGSLRHPRFIKVREDKS